LSRIKDKEKILEATYDWLEKNPETVLFYQRQQLFKKSIDREGKPLGFYKRDHKNFWSKKKGRPYKMVESGLFKANLKYKNRIFTSTVPYLKEMENNKNFSSTKFFGLTDDSVRRLYNNKIRPFIKSWMEKQLAEK